MANRTVYAGDVPTDDLFMLTDETFDGTADTVLNLTGTTIEIKYIGQDFQFSGSTAGGGTGGLPAAIWPPQADPDGKSFWNVRYQFAVGDCKVDKYVIFITVTDTEGHIDTYPTGDTLTVLALPVPA